MEIKLKYGRSSVKFNLNEKNHMDTILPNSIHFDLINDAEVQRAIQNPIGTKRLKDIVRPGESIVIITSDISRPMPSYRVLPHVIAELKQGGVIEEDITIVLARGTHRGHTENERKALVGEEIYNSRIKVIDSDVNRCIRLGTCKNGTPVDIFEPVVNADRRICLGNIEYHYFAGYSGGNKALMPGVSSLEAIQKNHSNLVHPEARAGNLDTNPVRQDIDEVSDFIPIDFIVNVILDDKKQIIKAVAGHNKEAHRAGCLELDKIYKRPLEKQADIVVFSPGGHPKDINLYQSHKSLENIKHTVRDGGIIIWCASSAEGFGQKVFEEWLTNKKPKEMINDIINRFILGGHKAASIALVLERVKLFMVSDLPDDLVRSIHLIPFATVQEAVDEAIRQMGENAKVLVLPEAGSVMPVLV